jgi:hypothetical protein
MGKPLIRKFDEDDWMGFGGAEHFFDGSEPLITELWNDTAEAIADRTGIQVHIFLPDVTESYLLPAPGLWSPGIGFAMLTRLREAVGSTQLEELGFKKIA